MALGPFTPTIRGYTEASGLQATDAIEIDRIGVGTMWAPASLFGGTLITFQGAGVPTAGAWLGTQPFPEAVTFAADWGDLFAWVLPASLPTASAVFTIFKASASDPTGTSVGTVTLATDGTVTGSTSGLEVTFDAQTAMVVYCPDPADATLADFAISLIGT